MKLCVCTYVTHYVRTLFLCTYVHIYICTYISNVQAEQCFKQSLSLDSSHLPSLLAYSMCCALDERYDEGETFLEMATQCEPDNALAWTIAG